MKNFIVIILVLALLVIVAGLIFTLTNRKGSTENQKPTNTETSGGAVEPAPIAQFTVRGSNNSEISVNDFRQLPETRHFADKVIEYYSFAEEKDQIGILNYEIQYAPKGQDFQIYIMNRPIKALREEAEAVLLSKLGITREQACQLKIYVNVPGNVDSFYAGRNLGLSFCPGSVELPE